MSKVIGLIGNKDRIPNPMLSTTMFSDKILVSNHGDSRLHFLPVLPER